MLALALGKHLHEIESLPQEEFARWMRFYSQEPFGLIRDDLRHGIVAATVAAPNMKKGKKAVPEDFMPKFRRPKHKQSKAEFEANVQRLLGMAARANDRKS